MRSFLSTHNACLSPCLMAVLVVGSTHSVGVAQTTFGAQQVVTGSPNLYRLKPFDVDSDGDMDLLGTSGNASNGTVIFIENLDAGGLGTPQVITAPIGGLRGLDFADLDGDGRRDLLVSDSFNDRIAWCASLPGGAFGSPTEVGDLDDPNGTVAVDLDGDGDMDIAALQESSALNQVGWFRNEGGGSFSTFMVISDALNDPEDVRAADLDNDGDMDLVTASSLDAKVAWYRNDGSGAFGTQEVITTGMNGVQRIAIGDIDGDGWLDVAAAARVSGIVAWYKNASGASFIGQPFLETGAGNVFGVAIADVNLDGNVDVLACSSGNDGVRWYENVGFGFFASAARLDGGIFANSDVAAMDIDGDSDIDIASARIAWNANDTRFVNEYCTSNPNSTGMIAPTFGTGSIVVGINDLTLQTENLPQNVFGYFLTSPSPGNVSMPAGSAGVLCLSGAVGRYSTPSQIRFSGGTRAFQLRVDLARTPDPQLGLIPILPGQTRFFQSWYRDSSGGIPTSNFSSGLALTFL